MATILRVKRRVTGAAGAPAALKSGELAYNMADGILYVGYGDDGSGNATSVKAFAKDDFVTPVGVYQPIDADLTAFGGLDGTAGIIVKTGAGAFTRRTITGTAARIVVTDGSGAAGNPTIDLATVTVGSSVSGGSTKFTVDGYGRVTNAGTASLTDLNSPTASFSMGSQRLTNLTDPSSAQDAATKSYVDAVVQGLDPKASVVAASTGNVNIASAPSTLDGITLVNGDRVLLKDQTTPAQNGIRIFTAAGAALARATDMDAWSEIPGAHTIVEKGTVNADTGWLFTADQGGTLDTTSITVSTFGGGSAGAFNTAGSGLTSSGTTVDVNTGAGITITSDAVALAGQALALHNVTTAADKFIYATGSGTFSAGDFTSVARTLVAQTTQALMRTTGLGLGSMSTQDASAVAITGGTIDGVTLDGGTF
jgi:hypothetical protein